MALSDLRLKFLSEDDGDEESTKVINETSGLANLRTKFNPDELVDEISLEQVSPTEGESFDTNPIPITDDEIEFNLVSEDLGLKLVGGGELMATMASDLVGVFCCSLKVIKFRYLLWQQL